MNSFATRTCPPQKKKNKNKTKQKQINKNQAWSTTCRNASVLMLIRRSFLPQWVSFLGSSSVTWKSEAKPSSGAKRVLREESQEATVGWIRLVALHPGEQRGPPLQSWERRHQQRLGASGRSTVIIVCNLCRQTTKSRRLDPLFSFICSHVPQ